MNGFPFPAKARSHCTCVGSEIFRLLHWIGTGNSHKIYTCIIVMDPRFSRRGLERQSLGGGGERVPPLHNINPNSTPICMHFHMQPLKTRARAFQMASHCQNNSAFVHYYNLARVRLRECEATWRALSLCNTNFRSQWRMVLFCILLNKQLPLLSRLSVGN